MHNNPLDPDYLYAKFIVYLALLGVTLLFTGLILAVCARSAREQRTRHQRGH